MSKVNYKYRSELLQQDWPKMVRKLDHLDSDNQANGVLYDPVAEDLHSYIFFAIGPKGLKECRRINRNKDNKTYRIRKRLKDLIESGSCIFLTITFRDDVLEHTSDTTRRRYVARFLDAVPGQSGYVANIDFGVDDLYTKREHYHAVVCAPSVSQDMWPYGNLDYKRVRINKTSIKKVPRYLAKLTLHAVKDSASKNKVLYSKKKKKTKLDQVQEQVKGVSYYKGFVCFDDPKGE